MPAPVVAAPKKIMSTPKTNINTQSLIQQVIAKNKKKQSAPAAAPAHPHPAHVAA